jgi:hypothetical protein
VAGDARRAGLTNAITTTVGEPAEIACRKPACWPSPPDHASARRSRIHKVPACIVASHGVPCLVADLETKPQDAAEPRSERDRVAGNSHPVVMVRGVVNPGVPVN